MVERSGSMDRESPVLDRRFQSDERRDDIVCQQYHTYGYNGKFYSRIIKPSLPFNLG
jgi:hypothetical protein